MPVPELRAVNSVARGSVRLHKASVPPIYMRALGDIARSIVTLPGLIIRAVLCGQPILRAEAYRARSR